MSCVRRIKVFAYAAILTSELEVRKKESSTDRPPILPAPAHDIIKAGGQQ